MNRIFHILPAGLLSFNYDVLEGEVPFGAIENHAALLQIKGILKAGEKEFFTRRQGAFRAVYLLETSGGAVVAQAAKKMGLTEHYEVSFGGRSIHLKKKALSLKETFVISAASGEIGTIVQESLLSRRLLCQLDATAGDIPPEVLLFLIWMALTIRRKDASASS
jgi:hypothetical protein